MKALMLTVTVGEGHNSTAKAAQGYFAEKGYACTILNTLKYVSPLAAGTMDKGYVAIARMSPKMNAAIYNSASKKSVKIINNTKRKTVAESYGPLCAKKLGDYVAYNKPDVIICTHVIAAMLIAYARSVGKVRSDIPIIGINTDFALHPFWEHADIDYYVLANEKLFHESEKRKLPQEKLLPFGIPIKPNFMKSISKQEAREQLGLKDKPTILFMRGSFGFGKVVTDIEMLDNLPMDMQVLVVCGSNVATRKKLEKKEYKKDIHIYGFVENIDVMMDAADFAVTKPGGLSTSECMAKGLPMILMSPIPGVEDRNLAFMMNNGLAIGVDDKNVMLDDAVQMMLTDPTLQQGMREKYKEYGRPNAGKDLVDFVTELLTKQNHDS